MVTVIQVGSENESFPNPANLFVIPDHYIFRMLFSQGISLTELGVRSLTDTNFEKNPRKIWQKFSDNYHLFRGTPTALWLDYSFEKVFGLTTSQRQKMLSTIMILLRINSRNQNFHHVHFLIDLILRCCPPQTQH